MAQQQAQLVITATDKTREAFESVKRSLEGMKQGFETVKKIATFGFLGHEVQEFAHAVVEAGVKFERSQNLLNATLKATGYQAGITSTQVNELAESLSHVTRFDDEDLREGMTTLVRFGAVSKDTLDQVGKATANLATLMGGNFSEAAHTMGRALQGSERDLRALREVLPRLSERTIFQITQFAQLGQKAEVARRVLQAVEGQIDGLAQAENTGLLQATTDLAKAADELKKAFASAFGPAIIEAMQLITAEFRRWTDLIKDVERALGKLKIPEWLRDALSRGTPFGEIPAADLKPSAAQKSAEEERKEEEEKRKAERGAKARVQDNFLNEQRAAKERIDLVRTQNDEIEKAQTQSAKEIEANLKHAYDNGLLDAENYYKALEGLQRNAIDVSVTNTQKLIAAQRASLATTLPDDQRPIKAAIEKEQAEIRNKRQEQAGLANETERKLTEETNRLIDGRNELDAKIAEQEGRLSDAEKIRFGLELRRQQELLGQLSGPQAAARSKELLDLSKNATAQRAYAESLREVERIKRGLANDESDVASALEAGEITTYEAMQRTDAVRQNRIEQLRQEIALQERSLAGKTKISAEERLAVETAKSELKALASAANQTTALMRHLLEDSLNQPLLDFINHTKSAKDAFLDFAKNVQQALLQIATRNLAESIFSSGTAGGSGGGLLAGAAPFLAKLFSGSGAAATGATVQGGAGAAFNAAATVSAMGNVMTPHGAMELQRYSMGGIATRPQLALFGEGRQNEAYVPLPDGRRIPVAMKGGGNVQHLTVNIATPDAQSFKRSESQVITSIAMAGRRAMARR